MVGKRIERVSKERKTKVRISKTKKSKLLGERERRPREELGRGNSSNCCRNLLN